MKNALQSLLYKMGYEIKKIQSQEENDIYQYEKYFPKGSITNRAFYNISAGGHFGFGGNFLHPLWTNIDVDREYPIPPQYNEEKDIALDLLEEHDFPLQSDSAELFHSRFSIEHITDSAALKMFREVHRCLKKGGIFRIIVPNLQLDYEAYIRKDYKFFSWIENFSQPAMMELMKYKIPLNKASLQQVFIVHFAANASTIHQDGAASRITDEELDNLIENHTFHEVMDFCISRCSLEKQKLYRQNHINWWSSDKMRNFLKEAGFKETYSLIPGQSLSPVMRNRYYFDNLWNDVCLFMEAVK